MWATVISMYLENIQVQVRDNSSRASHPRVGSQIQPCFHLGYVWLLFPISGKGLLILEVLALICYRGLQPRMAMEQQQ